MASDLMLKPASELSALIKSLTVSARELLREAVARYEMFNPSVNAITESRVEIAQERALAAAAPHANGASKR